MPQPASHVDSITALPPSPSDFFEAIVSEVYGTLCTYAFRLVRSRADAEDVVHEVLVRAWRSRETIEPATARSYLLRAVHNEAISWNRRQRRVESLDTATLPFVDETSVTDPSLEVELVDAMSGAMQRLGPRSREIFSMSRDEGLTYREIAVRLGISVKTVETLMGRTLHSLRKAAAPFLPLMLATVELLKRSLVSHVS